MGRTPATTFDDVVYKLQDKLIDTKRVIEAITGHAGKIKDALDVYLQSYFMAGRQSAWLIWLNGTQARAEPNADDGHFPGRHGGVPARTPRQEANALIAGRDPAMPDGGSGMTNQAAADYMTRLPPDQRRKLEIAATKIDAIITATRASFTPTMDWKTKKP